MSEIVTRRDYHLTKFRMEQYLEKGFDKLSQLELDELKQLSKEMSRYEQLNQPARQEKTQLTTRNPN